MNDLLDYSQIESNDLQVLPTTFTPQELLSDLIAQANRDAEVKGLELVYFQSKLPESFTGDKDKIEQVAHHLIRNAIKYTDKGFVLIEVEYQREILSFRRLIFVLKIQEQVSRKESKTTYSIT